MTFDQLLALARQGLANEVEHYDGDDQAIVFAFLVDGVRQYAAEWERRDLEQADARPLSSVPDEDLTLEGASTGHRSLADLLGEPRWQVTLRALHENLEMD